MLPVDLGSVVDAVRCAVEAVKQSVIYS